MAKREAADRQRIRKALESSTMTPHTLVPAWKKTENEEAAVQRRGAVRVQDVKPIGRRVNDANNSYLAKASKTVKKATTKAALEQSGVGIRTTRAFGVAPMRLL